MTLFLSCIVRGENAGNRASRHLQFQIIRLNAQYQSIIVDRNNGTDDAAAGDDGLAIGERFDHLLLISLLTLHRAEDEEIEDGDHQNDGHGLAQRGKGSGGGGRRCL